MLLQRMSLFEVFIRCITLHNCIWQQLYHSQLEAYLAVK